MGGAGERSKGEAESTRSKPGDEAPPGTAGTGQNLCPECGGTGRKNGTACPNCKGTGTVTTGIGGG